MTLLGWPKRTSTSDAHFETAKNLQLLLKVPQPGEEIGEGIRADRDQCFRLESDAGAAEEHFDGRNGG